MDNSQNTTTPLSRFFTFWWILAGFAAFGVLTLVAYAIGGRNKDQAYEKRMSERLAIMSEVTNSQTKQFKEVEVDIAAGAKALSAAVASASAKIVPGTPTYDKMIEEMNAKAAAEEAAKAAAEPAGSSPAIKLSISATNSVKGEPPLQYVEKELTAPAGEAIELTFNNPDIQMHNFVLCKAGKSDSVAALALAMAADPEAMAKGYIPESGDILAHTKLLMAGQKETIKFTSPAEPGDYPYLCTFPGHSVLMKGVFKVTAALAKKPVAPAAAEAAQKLSISATNSIKGEPPLQYVEKELTAEAGKPVELTFNNPDIQMHNFVLCKVGKLDAVAALALAMAADPQAMAKGYIPETDDILAHTKLLMAGQKETIKFTAPAEPGEYPYVCTFPGHYVLMRGVLKVTPAK